MYGCLSRYKSFQGGSNPYLPPLKSRDPQLEPAKNYLMWIYTAKAKAIQVFKEALPG